MQDGELIPTRRSLLSRLKSWEDQESWRQFFNTYWKLLFNVARKSGLSDAEAEDVVQETIIAVAKKIPGFTYNPAVGSFKGWLLQIVRWKVGDLVKRRQRARNREARSVENSMALEVKEQAEEFESLWEREWEQNALTAALERVKEQVSPKQFQIYDLYVIKNWPVEQIASVLKITPNQIYVARSRLSKLMEAEIKRLREGESS